MKRSQTTSRAIPFLLSLMTRLSPAKVVATLRTSCQHPSWHSSGRNSTTFTLSPGRGNPQTGGDVRDPRFDPYLPARDSVFGRLTVSAGRRDKRGTAARVRGGRHLWLRVPPSETTPICGRCVPRGIDYAPARLHRQYPCVGRFRDRLRWVLVSEGGAR